MHVFLETERLILRRFTMEDIDNLVALDGDPEVMRFLNGLDAAVFPGLDNPVGLPGRLKRFVDAARQPLM